MNQKPRRPRRTRAEIDAQKREAQIALARSQVAYWTETLADHGGSPHREVWEMALKAAQERLTSLEAV